MDSVPGHRDKCMMGECLRAANHLSILRSHPGQLSLLPSVGWVIGTSQSGDALWLRVKGMYGSFYLWINVSVAGKTV